MKTKIVFYLFLIALINVQSCTNKDNLSKAKVSLVDLETFTSINVSCDKLEDYFGESIVRFEMTPSLRSKFMQELDSLITRTKIDKEGVPDVRIKVELDFDNNTKKTVCIGNNLISYNNIVYDNDDKFREFLVNNLYK
jgi:hypothetical protein